MTRRNVIYTKKCAKLRSHFAHLKKHRTHAHRNLQPKWVRTRTSQLATAHRNSQLAIAQRKSCLAKDVDETHQCLGKCVLELETLSAICLSAWPKSRSANLLRNAFQLCKQATDYYIHSDIFVKISFGKYPKQNKLTHLFSIKCQSKSCSKKTVIVWVSFITKALEIFSVFW